MKLQHAASVYKHYTSHLTTSI